MFGGITMKDYGFQQQSEWFYCDVIGQYYRLDNNLVFDSIKTMRKNIHTSGFDKNFYDDAYIKDIWGYLDFILIPKCKWLKKQEKILKRLPDYFEN